jgi:hypothetical protein
MKVTKQQKIFAGLLALGLVALAMDRFVFSPQTAQASDDSAALLVAKPSKVATPTIAASGKLAVDSSVTNPIALKLNALSDSLHLPNAPVKDAFLPSQAWLGKPSGERTDPKTFEQMHQLSGVMLSGSHPAAMINGKLVSVGDMIDGYRLISVAPGAANLQMDEIKVTLHSR